MCAPEPLLAEKSSGLQEDLITAHRAPLQIYLIDFLCSAWESIALVGVPNNTHDTGVRHGFDTASIQRERWFYSVFA